MTLRKNDLVDMGGVLVRGSEMVPGDNKIIVRLNKQAGSCLVQTGFTRREDVARFP